MRTANITAIEIRERMGRNIGDLKIDSIVFVGELYTDSPGVEKKKFVSTFFF